MGLSRLEQEVVITFNAEESTAHVYTANPVWIRKMDKLLSRCPEEVKEISHGVLDGEVISHTYEVPKKYVKVSVPRKGREFTEEERKAMADRLLANNPHITHVPN